MWRATLVTRPNGISISIAEIIDRLDLSRVVGEPYTATIGTDDDGPVLALEWREAAPDDGRPSARRRLRMRAEMGLAGMEAAPGIEAQPTPARSAPSAESGLAKVLRERAGEGGLHDTTGWHGTD